MEARRGSFPGSFLFLLLVVVSVAAGCDGGGTWERLNREEILGRQDWWDNQDWDWYLENIPFFESPDADLDATYYYRWELLTKHLTYGSPETGYTFTEFIDRPSWSGTYGAISCPLGHQFYEVRWLKDRRIIEDFSRYWFETPGAEPRSYSNWYGDAMWAIYQVLGDKRLLEVVYPHMKAQVAGWTAEHWDPNHEMYRWVGAWDGMETNINSRLTDDTFAGAEGYRPTLNSYLYADLSALSRAAAILGKEEEAAGFRQRAEALKIRVQDELWDPAREFFFHQFAEEEKDGIQALSLTYETGPYAGDPHGRELLGYVPWQFNLPDPGYESAWRFLMDSTYFLAPYGPTGVERGDPQFFVSPRCCVWSGNAWPYATTQTLAAMANLLNNYRQDVVDKDDYFSLLRTYALSQRKDGRPYIAEAADPFTGSWAGHNSFYHSEHYLHSGFVDLIITGLVGLRPQAGDSVRVNPLVPDDWAFFALEGVDYHGHDLSVFWDRDGGRYGLGPGLVVLLDGRELGRSRELRAITAAIPPPVRYEPPARLNNYAVKNDGGPFPFASVSSNRLLNPAFYAVDGNRWYHPSPPNRWVSQDRSENGEEQVEWFSVDFGTPRTLTQVKLYFLDDGTGPAVEATGEEGGSGYPLSLEKGLPQVRPPATFEVQAWNGTQWEKIPNQVRSPPVPEGRKATTIRFPELTTNAIRAVFRPQPGHPVGLTEMEAWGPETTQPRPGSAWEKGTDLALVTEGREFPRVAASFTSRSDDVREAFDGRFAFTRNSRNRWTSYGTPNPEDWLQVEFESPETVTGLDLFFFGDGRGVAAPSEYRILYRDHGKWADAAERWRTPQDPTAWAQNYVLLEPVETDAIRVLFRHSRPASTGVTELRVWGTMSQGS